MTQDEALALLKTGSNVFLTGEPGAGKTHTIRSYVAWLSSRGLVPAVTASTGIAATHLGGMTVHAWSGIGIQSTLVKEEAERLAENPKLRKRIQDAPTLIIDEISMLDARTLDLVDLMCRTVRESLAPFGGMQVVFVGDFFQLPPVSRFGEPAATFAFRSAAWQAAMPAVCYLTEQHRQADQRFLELLGSIRRGRVSAEGRQLLRERHQEPREEVLHTRLSSHNLDVDRINQTHLAALPGEVHVFEMLSRGPEKFVASLKKNCLSPERLVLKEGARVMFTKNHPDGSFVNGTLGEVIAFEEETGTPVVRTAQGRELLPSPVEWALQDGSRTLAKINQLPLRLAWAMTVHKSQGMTLDAAVIDLSKAFEFGQGYVALSRVRHADGLFLQGWNERALSVHPDILRSDAEFREQSEAAQRACSMRTAPEQTALERRFVELSGGTWEERVQKEPGKRVKKPKKMPSYLETLALLSQGFTIEGIAAVRGVTATTIWGHMETLCLEERVRQEDLERLVPESLRAALPTIQAALKAQEDGRLTPVFERFKGQYTYGELRLARLLMV
jgi:hypothetical protein